ncbi:hypothetical protein [Jatrophihabitans sp.]|uniref:hypothetical protein n=1 Tax=Jatrophihabitans sp. TaxID=1932789 RepID=UPI0030C6E27A|nr:hypothetical protein [Jatrophihabitans sp.]
MPAEPIIYAPADRPAVEVLVEGTWCYGVLRMWTPTDAGWVGDVQYFLPGETSGRLDTFSAEQIREDTVDRSHGRS